MSEWIWPQKPWRRVRVVSWTSILAECWRSISGLCIASIRLGGVVGDWEERYRSRQDIADFASHRSRDAGNSNLSSVKVIKGGFWRAIEA